MKKTVLHSRIVLLVAVSVLTSQILLPYLAWSATGSLEVTQPISTGSSPPAESGGGASTPSARLQISNVSVTVSYDSATVSWTTSELSLSRLAWGPNRDYSSGTVAGEQFTRKHSAFIASLQPYTNYYFSLTAIGTDGDDSNYAGEFVTLARPDTVPPDNVVSFTATAQADHIFLSWQNPSDLDFEKVRIVRSDKFFPLDPYNGQVVYEGLDSVFRDTSVTPGVIYYYTAFTQDQAGNYSSGSLAFTLIPGRDGQSLFDPGAPVVDLELPSLGRVPANPSSFTDFKLIAPDGEIVDSLNPTIALGEDLKIAIPKDKLPSVSSFLTLTVQDLNNQNPTSTYLFSYNQAGNEYVVKTPEFRTGEVYGLVVSVFTASKLIIEKINGQLRIINTAQASSGEEAAFLGGSSLPKTVAVAVAAVGVVAVAVHFLRVRLRWPSRKR
jgi:hypothetical protein